MPAQRLWRLALALHQHAEAAAALPIEQLQAQLLVALGPGGELLAAPEEGIAGDPLHWQLQLQCLDRLAEPTIGWLHQAQLSDPRAGDPVAHRRAEALALHVVHRPAGGAQLLGEVAHGAPHQYQLLAVIGAALQHRNALHQQHPRRRGIHTGQGALGRVQLIPEHPDANRHAGASPARRQALRATAAA